MLETELITRVLLFDPVNQCQGFCWDTKRKQFILATISSDNKTQDIFRISFDGPIISNYRFNDRPRLGHMNTLTYRRDTDVIYTTNATIDGFLLTALDAKDLSVKEEIKMPYKVFNVAYDPFTHKFVSIRPYKKNIRLIQEYTVVSNDNKPQFMREYELDCINEDINNNGAFVFLDNIIFTTLTHLIIYDTFNNVKTMVELPKDFEVEDIDIVDSQLYCSVYHPKGIVEIHRILGLDSQLTKTFVLLGFKSQFFNAEVKIMQVVSYVDLFGDNDFISCCEEDVLIKDGIKYLPLDVVYAVSSHYETKDIQEVEFE